MGLICIIHRPKDLGLNFDMLGEVILMELILHIDTKMAFAKAAQENIEEIKHVLH